MEPSRGNAVSLQYFPTIFNQLQYSPTIFKASKVTASTSGSPAVAASKLLGCALHAANL
jgi:hypothetical protein